LLGHLDKASFAHGLATTTGIVSHTGVGGFTLGGGMGRMDRKFGLAIDNLLSAELVSADGRMRRLNDNENADLFWAIRGGGGNFGVVTQFEFQLHPFETTVIGGGIYYPFSQARDLLTFFAEYSADLPDEINVEPNAFVTGEGERIVSVSVTYAGDLREGEKVLAPLRAFGRPLEDTIGPSSYAEMQTQADEYYAHGTLNYLKSGYFSELTPAAIAAIVESYDGDPPWQRVPIRLFRADALECDGVRAIRAGGDGGLTGIGAEARAVALRLARGIDQCPIVAVGVVHRRIRRHRGGRTAGVRIEACPIANEGDLPVALVQTRRCRPGIELTAIGFGLDGCIDQPLVARVAVSHGG
jgi:hypothetical protein